MSQSNPCHNSDTHTHTHANIRRERETESLKLKSLFESCVSFSMRSSGKLRLKPDGFIEGEKIKAQQVLHLCAYSINSCVYACRCMYKNMSSLLVEKKKKRLFPSVSVETKNFVCYKANITANRQLFENTAFISENALERRYFMKSLISSYLFEEA